MRLSTAWKERVATLVQVPIIYRCMYWGVRLAVARHRIGVAIVLFNEAQQVLLLRHVFRPLAPWGLPGGWVARNESPEEGVLRELREETGLNAELGPMVHMEYARMPAHLAIAYAGQPGEGNVRLSGEILEAEWVDWDRLAQFSALPFTRRAIAAARLQWTSRGELA